MYNKWIAILDFGAPHTQPMARGLRAQQIYAEILPYNIPAAELSLRAPAGIILALPEPDPDSPPLVPDPGLANLDLPQLALDDPTYQAQCNTLIKEFAFNNCGCSGDWHLENWVNTTIARCREQIGDEEVVLGLSGGVDSSVVAVLLHKAIGKRLHCIFVDNGLLRFNERQQVEERFRAKLDLDLHVVDASQRFYDALKGVSDPEQKRKIIGRVFIDVFAAAARKFSNCKFLAQGTIYPDVIESQCPVKGNVIKSHHNVGGLPDDLKFELVEPVRELFKDEVRAAGRIMGIDDELLDRQPFPGPGLGVRILGEITAERVHLLQQADIRVQEEMRKLPDYKSIWQSFAVLLPVSSVGMMDGKRTYENVCALRVVDSIDAMTADWTRVPYDTLAAISNRIINEVRGINRVVFDISAKPPATIEWE